ncbi:MAG: DNA polymerase [Verrucomicrobiota bacterium]
MSTTPVATNVTKQPQIIARPIERTANDDQTSKVETPTPTRQSNDAEQKNGSTEIEPSVLPKVAPSLTAQHNTQVSVASVDNGSKAEDREFSAIVTSCSSPHLSEQEVGFSEAIGAIDISQAVLPCAVASARIAISLSNDAPGRVTSIATAAADVSPISSPVPQVVGSPNVSPVFGTTAGECCGQNAVTSAPQLPKLIIPTPFPETLDGALDVYQGLGLAIYPCNGPKEGGEGERGKKPKTKGWRDTKPEDLTPAVRKKYFRGRNPSNVGCVVRGPFVAVDLDSKHDQGQSVQNWLGTQKDLAVVPRERTGGGAHLWFICPDLPEFKSGSGQLYRKNLVSKINDDVTAELIHSAGIILSPSVHPSGAKYHWDVAGSIPVVPWAQLKELFGFENPAEQACQKSRKAKRGNDWGSNHKGNLRTLNIINLTRELGIYGEIVDADKCTHSVLCPWRTDHSDHSQKGDRADSSTVIFDGDGEKWPGFKCLHAHCAERELKDFLEWAEIRKRGIVDKHCAEQWEGTRRRKSAKDDRPSVILPTTDRSDSDFALDVSRHLEKTGRWFNYNGKAVVIRGGNGHDAQGEGFTTLTPSELITEVERDVRVGFLEKTENGDVFRARSMSETCARILLASSQFVGGLPRVQRMLDVPIPMYHGGTVTFPKKGYDPRFSTYLKVDAPTIEPMSLVKARRLFDDLLGDKDDGGFCWKDEQSKVHARARMLTPFCRGLMGTARPPFWMMVANRPRCGKDYFAQIPSILFHGRKIVCPPLSSDSDDEMRKRITTALMQGSPMLHFANFKGHIRFASLEAATDNTGVWQDRLLGGNKEVHLDNPIEFSLSANSGTTWEPDIAERSRLIALHYDREHINQRAFKHDDLHAWVATNRTLILSACAAFVQEWEIKGRPLPAHRFASFPEWARVVGGIMTACDLGDPCLPHADTANVAGDQQTEEMRDLFERAFNRFGEQTIKKQELVAFIEQNQSSGLFEWLDMREQAGKVRLGKLIAKFDKRELNGIRLEIPPTGKNNVQYRFIKAALLDEQGISGVSGISKLPLRVSFDEAVSTAPGEHTVLKGLEVEDGGSGSSGSDIPDTPDIPSLVTSPEEMGEIVEELQRNPEAGLALDLETYNDQTGKGELSPFVEGGQIRLLALSLPNRTPWIIDLRAVGYDLEALKSLLETRLIIGHNLKFDALWLAVKCGVFLDSVFCTMSASRLLTAGLAVKNDLGTALERYLGKSIPKDQAKSNWSSPVLSREQLVYSANDVRFLHALKSKQEEELETAQLSEIMGVEMCLLPHVVKMELSGLPADVQMLESLRQKSEEDADAATSKVRALLNSPHLNLGSVPQLTAAFAKAGIVLKDTSADTFGQVDHPAARLLLEVKKHRNTAQQAKSFVEAVCADGRIHAQFNPLGTDTGRFSSSNPNIQQIQRGAMREAFRAPVGKKLIVADYSQIELRAAAAISKDPVMLEVFKNGEDLHRKTASIILGKPEADVTKEDRHTAKAVNFGLIYGQGAQGLVSYARDSYGVELSYEQAATMREQFFSTYEGVKGWHGKCWGAAKGRLKVVGNCTRSICGRRRLLEQDLTKSWSRFTTLVNTPVQASCADGLKEAMCMIGEELPEGAEMIASVHDEIVVLADESTAEAVRDLVVDKMKESMSRMFPDVPIEVESRICSHWGEK